MMLHHARQRGINVCLLPHFTTQSHIKTELFCCLLIVLMIGDCGLCLDGLAILC